MLSLAEGSTMTWRLVAMLVVSGAGCAGLLPPEGSGPDRGQYFTIRTSRDTVQALLEGRRFFGPDLELALLPDGYRGHSLRGLIDLRSSPDDRIFGTVGSVATELYFEQSDESFLLDGLYAGRLGSLAISPERLVGSVGACEYDLECGHASAARYHGRRSCQGAITGVLLTLPPALLSRSAADRAVLLAVFLGS
jgi:hypothetical protein